MKGILILGEYLDPTCNEVVEWLRRWNLPFLRMNTEDRIDLINLNIEDENELIIKVNSQSISLHDFGVFWYRRGQLIPCAIATENKDINDFLKNEWQIVEQIISYQLNGMVHLGDILHRNENKLFNLRVAQSVGLKTPKTRIINNKRNLEAFQEEVKSLISKPISECRPLTDQNGDTLFQYTTEVTSRDIQNLPEQFSFALFQEKIERFCDIRVFFLFDKFYSMAIFSTDLANVDIRDHQTGGYARHVPFNLPHDIKEKLKSFCEKVQLTSGSFDLIMDKSIQFYFIEVNPCGSIEMISKRCNYPIEKDIAYELQAKIC